MSKLYLTYNDKNAKREYYSYTYNGTNPVHLTLKEQEIEAYFQKVLSSNISSINSINDNVMELVLDNGETIVIDSSKLFKTSDIFDSYVYELESRIKDSLEQRNISTYKNSLPAGYSPHVNRRNNKNKYLMDDNLATSILLGADYHVLIVDIKDENEYNSEVTKGL